jgi:tetratricopeptide (TPR) repeat protein
MDLAGKLSTLGLAEVFQNIAFNSHTGTLLLKHGSKKAWIAFDNGRIRATKVAGEKLDYLDIARRSELASEDVLAKAAAGRRTLKSYLLAAGELDEPAYDSTIAAYVEETILPLFGWTRASFAFEEGKVKERIFDSEQLGCAVDLDPQGVAMEAARRADEWEGMEPYVPADEDVLVLNGGRPTGDLPPQAERLFPLLDGTRDLAAVIKEAPLKKFDVLKAVSILVEQGVLVPATADRGRELATQAAAAGKVTLAARRLEVALDLDPDDLETRRDLVRLFERAGRKFDAAREQTKLAAAQADRGDVDGALESYERAEVLSPGDLDVLEKILNLYEKRGDRVRAVRVGRRLAEALVVKELYEDALPLYERMLKENEQSVSLREALANCLVKLAEPKKAANQLLILARRAYDRNEFEVARKYYQRIVTLVPKHKESNERTKEIESGVAAARLARKRRRYYRLAYVCVLALLGYQCLREFRGHKALHNAASMATQDLARDNGDRTRAVVLARYARLCSEHPLTHSGTLAGDSVRELLEAEIARMREWLSSVPLAKTTIDVEYRLGRAEKMLNRIEALDLPGSVQPLWDDARDDLTRRMAQLVER